MSYEYIYKLKPVEEIEPGWYKLRWRPIKHKGFNNTGTWNLYMYRTFMSFRKNMFRFSCYDSGAHNGWGRSYDGFVVEVTLIWFVIGFWIRWNIKCMAEGPQDIAEEDKKPLDLSGFKGGKK